MHSKERMLIALHRGKPDRLPVIVHRRQQYHLDAYLGGGAFGSFSHCRIVSNGCDVSETLAPVSIGSNQEPWDFRTKIGDRLAVIGGMDQFNVLTNGTPQQIRFMVTKLFETVGPNGGYICSTSDHFFETPVENLRIFAKAAQECVY